MVNNKKIMNELVKNFYKKKGKFDMWQITDYDNISSLVLLNSYSIFRVFKDEILPIKENEKGLKGEAIKKIFSEDISDYKNAEKIEIEKIGINKKFYNCLDGICYFDNDTMKYLDSKIEYMFYYRDEKSPIYVTTGNNYRVAIILPTKIK